MAALSTLVSLTRLDLTGCKALGSAALAGAPALPSLRQVCAGGKRGSGALSLMSVQDVQCARRPHRGADTLQGPHSGLPPPANYS